MNWKKNFKEEQELILATCSKKGLPNANIVISLGFVDNQLLVADCQMRSTIKNLLANKKICVVGKYHKLTGTVKIFTSGKYFDICKKKSQGYTVKHAILIKTKSVFDLDKAKKII